MNINLNTNNSINYSVNEIKLENKKDSNISNSEIKTSESYSDTQLLSKLTEKKIQQGELKKILGNFFDIKQKYKNTTIENFVFEEALKAFKSIPISLTAAHYKALLKLLKKESTIEDIKILVKACHPSNQRVWFYLQQLLSYPQYHSYHLSQILEEPENKLKNASFSPHTLMEMIEINMKIWELSYTELEKWDTSLVEYQDKDILLEICESANQLLSEQLYDGTSELLKERNKEISSCFNTYKIICVALDEASYSNLKPFKKMSLKKDFEYISCSIVNYNQIMDNLIEQAKIDYIEKKILKRDLLTKTFLKFYCKFLKDKGPLIKEILRQIPAHFLQSYDLKQLSETLVKSVIANEHPYYLILTEFFQQCLALEKKHSRPCSSEEIDKILKGIEVITTKKLESNVKDFSTEAENFSKAIGELIDLRNEFKDILTGYFNINKNYLDLKSSQQEKIAEIKKETQLSVSKTYEESLDIWDHEPTTKKKKKKKKKKNKGQPLTTSCVKKESPEVKKVLQPTSKMTLITSQNTVSKKEIAHFSKEQIFETKKAELFLLLKDNKKELFLLAFVGLVAERIHEIKLYRSKNAALDQEVIDHLLLASLGIENLLKALRKNDILQFAGTYPMLLMDWHIQVEQSLNQFYSEKNEKFPFHHSLVSRSQEVNQWEKLKDAEKQYLSDLDLGLLWARYPMNFIDINKDKNLKMLNYLNQILNSDWIEPNILKEMLTNISDLQVKTLEWVIKFYNLEKDFKNCLFNYNNALTECLLENGEYLTNNIEKTKLPLYKEANKIDFFIKNKSQFFTAPKELLDISSQLKKFQATVLSLKDKHIPLYQEAWHYRNVMFVQWLFEKIYHSRLQLIGEESKEHSFAMLEMKLDEKFSFKSFLTKDFFFAKAVHYPRISELFPYFLLTPTLKTYRNTLDTMFYRITHLVDDGFQLAGASKEPKTSEAVIEKAKELALKAQDVLCKEIRKLELDIETHGF